MSAIAETRARSNQGQLAGWIARIVHHDEGAFAALHEAVSHDVYRIALRLVGRHAAAEEVVGDCLWQVWNQADRYTPDRGAVMAWIASIARSRALDSLRRRKVVRQYEESIEDAGIHERATDDEVDDIAGYQPEHDAPCAETTDEDAVRRLLDTLAPAQRQMLSLAFYAGLTHQEIAEHCDLPLGTVKSHLRRGLAALKEQCIEAGLVDGED